MKDWVSRWFGSEMETLPHDEQDLLSVQPTIAMDELEQRLSSEADAWAQQYEHALIQKVHLRTQGSEFDSHLPVRSRNRQMIHAITLLAVCLVVAFGLRFYSLPSPNQTKTIGLHGNQQENSSPSDVELQSLIASAHAVDEIFGKVAAGLRQRKESPRSYRVDTNAESILVNAAGHLKKPGRQYGRLLAWFDERLQLSNPESIHGTNDTPK